MNKMTPKDKALDIVNTFSRIGLTNFIDKDGLWESDFKIDDETAKQCALVCVDEIVSFIKIADYAYIEDDIEYWREVKKEIELL